MIVLTRRVTIQGEVITKIRATEDILHLVTGHPNKSVVHNRVLLLLVVVVVKDVTQIRHVESRDTQRGIPCF